MMELNYGDWEPDYTSLPSGIAACTGPQIEVSVVKFGLAGYDHEGFPDPHAQLEPAIPGRYLFRATAKTGIKFRWKIEGWGGVDRAYLHIFRRGSNRPIHRHVIPEAAGVVDWDGILKDILPTAADNEVLPQGVLTIDAGPYMAEVVVGTAAPNAQVITRSRRMYFDLAPIVVIGAGAAGISAVNTLLTDDDLKDDCQIYLLESRDRLGGRAHTIPFPKSAEPIDLGCQWLHDGKNNPWIERGAGSFQHDQTPVRLLAGTEIPAWPPLEMVEDILENCTNDKSAKKTIKAYVADALGVGIEDDLSCVTATAAYKLSVGLECELEESIEAHRFTRAKADADDEEEDHAVAEQNAAALVPEALSPLPDDKLENEYKQFEDTNYMPVEGYGTRVRYTALKLANDHANRLHILAEHAVKRIAVGGDPQRPPYLVLDVAHGGATRKLLAIAAIVAVPTPIIADPNAAKHIAFNPPLDPAVAHAFESLPLGHYKKIILKLNQGDLADLLENLARERGLPALTAMQAQPAQQQEHDSDEEKQEEAMPAPQLPDESDISLFTLDEDIPWKFLYRRRYRILVAFCGGKRAEELDNVDDTEAVAAAAKQALLAALGVVHAQAIADGFMPEVLTSRWSHDEHSLGAYSYTVVGGAGSRELLYSTCLHDRIVFAGEALWPARYGTAHGAWYSGVRAAKFLLAHRTRWHDNV
jgi:hypothetical protein